MGEKILVTYATIMGATTGIARAIGIELRAGGAPVRVLPIEHVESIEQYRSVVIGSPVYEGSWLDSAIGFVQQNRAYLSTVTVAYFAVYAKRTETPEMQNRRVQRAINRILERVPEVKPVETGMFTGAFNSRRWSLPTLLALKARGELPLDGDYRDWNAIQTWARNILPRINQQPVSTHG